jgi:predicted dehydrogenase
VYANVAYGFRRNIAVEDEVTAVVDGSKTATVTRLVRDEREISDSMSMEDVRKLFMGGFDLTQYYTQEVIEFDSAWGQQHAGVLENFAANILDGTPLLAPGSDGINGVRLANAIHLSSWLGKEVSLDFDEDEYVRHLNERIRAEGKFPEREA